MFKHLTEEQRVRIDALLMGKKHSVKEIASIIGCSPRTIFREKQRGKCKLLDGEHYIFYDAYSYRIAQDRYNRVSTAKGRPIKLGKNWQLVDFLCEYIKNGHYSPAAALAEIDKQGLDFGGISVTTIYRYIHFGYLNISNKHLPVGYYSKKNKKPKYVNHQHILDKSISVRPRDPGRQQFGFWEMDTVVGAAKGKGNKCLLVLTERKTRAEIVMPLKSKTAGEVVRSLRLLNNKNKLVFSSVFRNITCDNGCEFADVSGIEKYAPVYYCHPYSSWERGSNENQNKFIRRFAPKGSAVNKLKNREIRYIMLWMNNYPRKMLGWQRPADLFQRELEKLGIKNFIV